MRCSRPGGAGTESSGHTGRSGSCAACSIKVSPGRTSACSSERGIEKETRRSILQVLEARFGPVPAGIVEALADLRDLKTLESLTRTAAIVPDLGAFTRALGAV
ncbi:MAG: hypothetical protein HY812_19205 [Planctomycetes bacterium]|nr:hypothetical protein [Planctomycetota bacterium]